MRTGIAVMLACVLLGGPTLAEEKHPVKVLLLGIDGISMNLLEPLAEKGVIPNLKKLAEQGGWGKLSSFWPLRTMQVWTSIATGKLPGQHGIWDHVSNSGLNPPEYRTEERKVYTTADRKSMALWILLGAQHVRTLTVGWPTTWPAENVPLGVMVAPKVLYGDERRATIKGSFWRDAEGTVHPSRLASRVHQLIAEPQEVTRDEIAQFADVPPEGSPLYELPRIRRYVHALRWSIARARSVEAVTIGLLKEARPEVVMSYFQCTDSLLHRFWIFQKSEEEIRRRLEQYDLPSVHAPELKRRFGRVVEACYRDVDQRVGRILEATRGPDTLVLAVSDHGFGDGPKRHPFRAEPYGGIHWSDGAIVAAGGAVPTGVKIGNASVLDIAPTVLYLMNLPVAEDMRGKIIRGLFAPGTLKKRPVKKIQTYESEPQLEIPHPEGFPKKPDFFVW